MTPSDAQRQQAEEQRTEIAAMLETARAVKGPAFADVAQAILNAWRVETVVLAHISDPLLFAAARTNALWLVDRVAHYAGLSTEDYVEAGELAEKMFKLSFV